MRTPQTREFAGGFIQHARFEAAKDCHDEDISDAAYQDTGGATSISCWGVTVAILHGRERCFPRSVEKIKETMNKIITALVLAAGGNPRTVLHTVYPIGGKDLANRLP